MKLHKYQQYACEYIESHPIAALFLDMGLGKTIITLTAVNNLIYDYCAVSRVLVVAPLRVARDTWTQEVEKWEHLRNLTYAVAVGSEKERKTAVAQDTDLTFINRENIPWLIKNSAWKWDMVVIDELSSFKSHT